MMNSKLLSGSSYLQVYQRGLPNYAWGRPGVRHARNPNRT